MALRRRRWFNIDRNPTAADWIKVAARMKAIAAEHPELTEIEVRIRAERAHLATEPRLS